MNKYSKMHLNYTSVHGIIRYNRGSKDFGLKNKKELYVK